MGAGGARRSGTETISLGRRAAAALAELCSAMEERAGARGAGGTERLRALRYWGERARVVRGLVCGGILCRGAGAKAAGTGRRAAAKFARGILAASDQGVAVRGAGQHSPGISVCGLWISHGAGFEEIGGGRAPPRSEIPRPFFHGQHLRGWLPPRLQARAMLRPGFARRESE